MRGSQLLFAQIFDEPAQVTTKAAKGRSSKLNNARNEALVSRYFYYANFFERKYSYTYIVETVAQEFFLSPATVPEVIEANYEMLISLKKQQPTVKSFKEKWPHLVW